MIKLDESIVIERPPHEVFAYISDPAKLHEWNSSALEARSDSGAPLAEGATVTEVRKFLGRRIESQVEVTGFDPPRSLSLKSVSGPIPFEVTQELEAAGGGTRLRVFGEGEPGGFFKLAEPIVERAMRREIVGNLETLKDLLESGG